MITVEGTDAQVVCLATPAMGTRFELVLVGTDLKLLRAAGEEAIEHIEWLHRHCSRHDRASAISRINREPAGTWIPIDGELAELLALSLEMQHATSGWFDVCAARGQRLAESGFALSSRGVQRTTSQALIDLGGIAKGWALDRAAEILRQSGIECAFLHGGTSSVVALGTPPTDTPWRVALPGTSAEAAVWLDLTNQALGVSGLDGAAADGTLLRPGHVIAPRTGLSAGGVAASACIARSCAIADAWSTALLASGGSLPLPQGLTGALLDADDSGVHGPWRWINPHAQHTPFSQTHLDSA